jgi:hypothetical protein
MVRRRHNPFAAQLKRLPHKALLRRAEPFFTADRDELEAAMLRIVNGAEHLSYGGTLEAEIDCRVICFDTAEKARAMQVWIDASGIASRPRPEPPPNFPQLKVG